MKNRKPFDESMDEVLLNNGFAYYDDWEYGPMCGWSQDYERYNMRLMRHCYGYWLIIGRHASGENQRMNIGSSNNATEIITLRDLLKTLW